VQKKSKRILALLSDVDFSPQLVAILQELFDRGGVIRIVLIGSADSQIAKQIKLRGWKSKNIRQRGKITSMCNFLLFSIEIIRHRPNTLFASGQFATIIGMLSAKLFSIPNRVFIRHHSNIHHKYAMKFGIAIDQVSNRLATTIVAVSEVVKRILIDVESVNSDKVEIIYNGVNLIDFNSLLPVSREVSKQNFEKVPLFHIGVISRLTEWKGVEYTATAFVRLQKEFPESRLHIVGAFADSYLDVREILSKVASNTYTLDKVNSKIPYFLQGLDAFVHVPISFEDEAFGIVYIEALASGIPCIFTQSGVLNELETPDRYAAIVAHRNSEEIYLNLKEMIQGNYQSKSAVPESWLDQFSLDSMAKAYGELLLSESR